MLTVTSQRRRRPSLTPLIDVVFLLLIFFMIVSRLSVEQLAQLTLSTPGAPSSRTSNIQAATLTLMSENQILINGTPSSLEELLQGGVLQKDQPITLTLDADITFQQTLSTLEALHLAGYTQAKLATERMKP